MHDNGELCNNSGEALATEAKLLFPVDLFIRVELFDSKPHKSECFCLISLRTLKIATEMRLSSCVIAILAWLNFITTAMHRIQIQFPN